MGRASRKRREAQQGLGGRRRVRGRSKLYRELPAGTVALCEEILAAYTGGRPPGGNPADLGGWSAIIYAEAAALEALDILVSRRGHSGDLFFYPLLDAPEFEPLTAPMPALLQFLRARHAGQDHPVLLLDADMRSPALTLLLLAGQALVAACDEPPGAPGAAAVLGSCLKRLADDPLDARTPAGDMGFALSDEQRESVDVELLVRDEERRFLTGAVPVRRAVVSEDLPPLLVLDLAARPDVTDLLRLLGTDVPADGADTVTRWRLLPLAGMTLLRLEVQWLEPVVVSVAVVLDAEEYRGVLDAACAGGRLGLTGTDPADSLDELFNTALVPAMSATLADLREQGAQRRG